MIWLLACTTTCPSLTVDEAYDVPPPPGMRSLRVHGTTGRQWEPGQRVGLAWGTGSVVPGELVADEPDAVILYVPEPGALELMEQARSGITGCAGLRVSPG